MVAEAQNFVHKTEKKHLTITTHQLLVGYSVCVCKTQHQQLIHIGLGLSGNPMEK